MDNLRQMLGRFLREEDQAEEIVVDPTKKTQITIEQSDVDLTLIYGCIVDGCDASVRTPFKWSDKVGEVVQTSIDRLGWGADDQARPYCEKHKSLVDKTFRASDQTF